MLNRKTIEISKLCLRTLTLFLVLIYSNSLLGQGFGCEVKSTETLQKSSNSNQFDLTTEEILCLPDITFRLAFHFEADANGNNFICDSNDPLVANIWTTRYAPTLVNQIIGRLNSNMTEALLLNGDEVDAKIRFETFGEGECGNDIFVYNHNEPFNLVPGAFNVFFVSDNPLDNMMSGFSSPGWANLTLQNIINHWINGGNQNWWDVATLLGHEWGHSRGLQHTFVQTNPCIQANGGDINCIAECGPVCHPGPNPPQGNNCWNQSQNQLMMSNGNGNSNLTECEFGELWNFILNNDEPFQTFETCNLPPNNDRIVYDDNASIVWNTRKMFTKHIIIKSGTTITVDCEVLMGGDKEIFVENGAKLIVDGGTITSLCDQELWRGIKVEGGSDDYAVEIRPNSTIENTRQSAVSMFDNDSYLIGNGNAHVLIESSDFINCNRILALGSFTNAHNKSKVIGNVHDGGKYSVTNWNCRNVEVSGFNLFRNISESCIVNATGQMFIEGNAFFSDKNDILFASTSPSLASTIKDNNFFGRLNGVKLMGTSISRHIIEGNRFHSNMYGVVMDGDTHFHILDNVFTSENGGAFINNGTKSNLVESNNIFTNNIGLCTSGINTGFVINDNCYRTGAGDNHITGSIGHVQAQLLASNTGIFPANNCFTDQGSIVNPVGDFVGSFESIAYYEPNDGNIDCRDAVNAPSNVVIVENLNMKIPECGSEGGGPTDAPCNPKHELGIVVESLNELEKIMSTLDQKSNEFAVYTNCMKNVRSIWLELNFKKGNFKEARSYLSSQKDDDSKLLMFESYMLEKNTSKAKEYLKSLGKGSEQMNDFVTLQEINLKRIDSKNDFKVTAKELRQVYQIATKKHSCAAYGKSLYFGLTEELLSSEMPTILKKFDLEQRSAPEREENAILVYPVPFDNTLNIVFQQNPSKKSTLVIEDILGRRVVELKEISSSEIINTSNWGQGIYSLYLINDGKVIEYRKLSLVK